MKEKNHPSCWYSSSGPANRPDTEPTTPIRRIPSSSPCRWAGAPRHCSDRSRCDRCDRWDRCGCGCGPWHKRRQGKACKCKPLHSDARLRLSMRSWKLQVFWEGNRQTDRLKRDVTFARISAQRNAVPSWKCPFGANLRVCPKPVAFYKRSGQENDIWSVKTTS